MNKFLPSIAVALACISMAPASAQVPTTTVQGIRSLSRAEVEQGRTVTFDATVTFYRADEHNLFVQDGDSGIFVKTARSGKLLAGDRVRVKGTTAWGYGAKIFSQEITVLGHGAMPKPVPTKFDELIRGQRDSDLVTIRGVIHSADLDLPGLMTVPSTTLRILTDGGDIDAEVMSGDARALKRLLDAEVEITGVAGGRFDGKLQLTGILLHVSNLANVKVLKPAAKNPWSLPMTPMDQILDIYKVKNLTSRVRVGGSVTYFEPGSALVLENGDKSLWVKTDNSDPIHIGDWAQATGFPGVSNGFLVLTGSEVQDTGIVSSVDPKPVKWQDLASSKHIFDLISIEAKVVMEAREWSQDEYVLFADGHVFSAIYPHRIAAGALQPMRRIPIGARIRVTGICATDNANPFGHEVPFNILLRSADDLKVLANPSPLTVRNLAILAMVLLLSILIVGARAWLVDRKMRAKVAELGYLSQRRGEILEDINRSRPLAEILERITELASASLKGAPCWCQIADGAKLGNSPSELNTSGLRIIEIPITAHTGPGLGSIYTAFDARTTPRSDEEKTLAAAAALATLAIETSRLHSDLVHRSEFDMLTEVQNRFAFEKSLDEFITEARRTAGMFGMIYIDLNDFKQINDFYGHQVGDSYLKHVANRMKHQLRPGDILARLGGDEFAVLVRIVHKRADVEDIALRLEHCFNEPITIESAVLHGSASIGIALYPADAATNDGLLRIADTAMYEMKRLRRQSGESLGDDTSPKYATRPRR